MSRVFVVQRQQKRDLESGELVDRFDLSPAEDYGELVFLLEPSALPFRPRPVIAELHAKLCDLTADDYVLLIGNPCLIGWTVAVASRYCDRLKLLQWNSHRGSYLVVECSGI